MSSISVRQASVLLFLSLASQAMVQPFGVTQNDAAHGQVFAAVAQSVFLYFVVVLLCRVGMGHTMTAISLGGFGLVCLLAAAGVFLRTERFYRYAVDEPLPAALTLGLLVMCAAYALLCHTRAPKGAGEDSALHSFQFHTVARAGQVILWIFVASLGLLLVATVPSMRVVNLAPAGSPKSVLEACLRSLQIPVELMVCLWLAKGEGRQVQQGFGLAIAGAGALRVFLALGAELVLGGRAALHPQILHTLTRMGGISVFRRLDALHVGVWLSLLLVQSIVLLVGAQMALALLWRCKNAVCVGALCVALIPCGAVMSAIGQPLHATVLSCGVLVCFLWMWIRGNVHETKME